MLVNEEKVNQELPLTYDFLMLIYIEKMNQKLPLINDFLVLVSKEKVIYFKLTFDIFNTNEPIDS